VKREIAGAAAGAVVGTLGVASATAQGRLADKFFGDDSVTDVASAGNGGVATSSASGGAAALGDINSGGNAGNAVGVGDTWGGSVGVDGGDVANLTDVGVSVNGGTAISDASGGSYNLAFVS
jgi:hypothetical protein